MSVQDMDAHTVLAQCSSSPQSRVGRAFQRRSPVSKLPDKSCRTLPIPCASALLHTYNTASPPKSNLPTSPQQPSSSFLLPCLNSLSKHTHVHPPSQSSTWPTDTIDPLDVGGTDPTTTTRVAGTGMPPEAETETATTAKIVTKTPTVPTTPAATETETTADTAPAPETERTADARGLPSEIEDTTGGTNVRAAVGKTKQAGGATTNGTATEIGQKTTGETRKAPAAARPLRSPLPAQRNGGRA